MPAANPWTPCSKKLPELNLFSPWAEIKRMSEPVIVTYEAYLTKELITSDILAVYTEDGWYWYMEDEQPEKVKVEITAWMGLPDPYIGDGK